MTHPDQYGERGAWQDPQGRRQRDAYPRGPYQQGSYQQGPYQQGPYQQGPYQREQYGQGQYGQGPYQQPDPYRQRSYQQDPRRPGTYPPATQQARPSGEPERFGGADGNERLTVMTGAVLLVLLAAEGLTILQLGRLLTLHFFLGMLLLGPVVLKACSVTYRFFRYYTGSGPYRRKGPPAPLLRLLGPVVMLLTASVFGTGVMLAVVGPSGRQPWLLYHKGAFVLWFCAMAIHVLAYVSRLPRLLYAEARGEAVPPGGGRRYAVNGRPVPQAARFLGGRGVRLALLIGSLIAGLAIALLTVHLAGPWEAQFIFH